MPSRDSLSVAENLAAIWLYGGRADTWGCFHAGQKEMWIYS